MTDEINDAEMVELEREACAAVMQATKSAWPGRVLRLIAATIRDTLATKPADFLYLNNGVTAL